MAAVAAGFDSGSTGADGSFAPVTNTVVDLSLAGNGASTGVYDAAAGAIVFHYTTISIPTGVTITFKNHPHNPPVVWLASGHVTIAGSVVLDGSQGHANNTVPDYRPAGPGGFPGGLGSGTTQHVPTPGLGPGGGLPGREPPGSGGYATPGDGTLGLAGGVYGNPLIQPLIGGSGGAGRGSGVGGGGGGGGGGGAILIACSGLITLKNNGEIRAVGGGGGGSGGAIRLVANDIECQGGAYLSAFGYLGQTVVGQGRIRLETATRPGLTNFNGALVYPPPSYGPPGPILPTALFPTLRATMVADQNVPENPAGNVFGDPDVTIDNASPVTMQIQATGIPPGTIVKVRVAPDSAGAIFADSTPLVGTPQFSTAAAVITFPSGLSHVTLNAAFELDGQAKADPRGVSMQSKDGIASAAQPSQLPIRGVMTVNGRSIRRIEVTSNGDPASTRVVYHPDVLPSTVKSTMPASGKHRKLAERAAASVAETRRVATAVLARARQIMVDLAAPKAKVAESGRMPPHVSSEQGHPASGDERKPVSFANPPAASERLASYTPPARTATARNAAPALVAPRLDCVSGADPAYTYDKVHNRLTMTDPTGVTTYEYDAVNRLTKIINPSGQEITFTYDKVGRRKQMTYPNGVVTTYTYDAASRITRIMAVGPAGVVTDYQYTYDPVGNILTMTTSAGVHSYTYDGLYQLTGAVHPEAGNPAESFAYDPAGNRTNSHLSSFYTHDAANRLLEDAGHVYTYDANGNQTSRTVKDASGQPTGEKFVFTYNADNQLIGAKRYATAADANPAMTAEYIYDGLGRRLAKIVNGIVTEFVSDNEDILLELQGTGTESRKIVARYTHGPRIDEPLIMQRDTNGDAALDASYFYHADHLGTIRAITDASGNVVQTYTYDSFGQIIAQTGTTPNFFTYTARERDTETSLYYYRARYYDAIVGRFISEDPIGFGGGDIHLLRYVSNRPTLYSDPTGTTLGGDLLHDLLKAGLISGGERGVEEGAKRLFPGKVHLSLRWTIYPFLFHLGIDVFHRYWSLKYDVGAEEFRVDQLLDRERRRREQRQRTQTQNEECAASYNESPAPPNFYSPPNARDGYGRICIDATGQCRYLNERSRRLFEGP